MEIPPLNISVTKAAVNGQILDVIEYDEYANNQQLYSNRRDIAIPVTKGDKEFLLPVKGDYTSNSTLPGVYNAGCIDFLVYPEDGQSDEYSTKNMISMSNTDNIKELIKAGDAAKKLDEPFITSPDNITSIPIRDTDQPEMKCLKMALNAKNIDIDKYAGRFGDNFPNDKRQLKNSSATLNIIKRYCENCDMEAILILKDKSPDVPNPMNKDIVVSLTEIEELSDEDEPIVNIEEEEESSEYSDD